MPYLFFENYHKSYSSPFFSLTSFFCLCVIILVLIVPVYLAMISGDFWISTTTFYEQPKVSCNAHYILYLLQNGESRIYNSVTKLNDFYDNLLSVPITKMTLLDSNYDGKVDEFKFNISFTSDAQKIKNLKLIVFFNYTLSTKISFDMQTIALMDIDTPLGASYIKADGYLNLIQSSPLTISLTTQLQTYTNLFYNATTPYDFLTLFNIFSSRNVTTKYDYTPFIMPYRGSKETKLEISVKIPAFQSVWIESPTFYSLKMAWIQYITIMIPFGILMYGLVFCMLKSRILNVRTKDNIPRKVKFE